MNQELFMKFSKIQRDCMKLILGMERIFNPFIFAEISLYIRSKNRLLTVKLFLSLLKDFLFEVDMRRNP